jgi:hypothetical protein
MRLLIAATLLFCLCACNKPQVASAPQSPAAVVESFKLPVMPVTTTSTPGAPAWIDNPTMLESRLGGIAAIGISPRSVLNDAYFQRSEAHARGTNMMAKEINNRLRSSYSSVIKASTSASAMGNFQTAEALREDTLQQLVDMELVGVRTLYNWTDPQTGTLYTLLHLSANDFKGIYNQFSAKFGVKSGLDEAVAKLNTTLAPAAKSE